MRRVDSEARCRGLHYVSYRCASRDATRAALLMPISGSVSRRIAAAVAVCLILLIDASFLYRAPQTVD